MESCLHEDGTANRSMGVSLLELEPKPSPTAPIDGQVCLSFLSWVSHRLNVIIKFPLASRQ